MESVSAAMFVRESNLIEGIKRNPTSVEITEHLRFLSLDHVTVEDVARFVLVYQPNARLRALSGLNVRVGQHLPPPGGPLILIELKDILRAAHEPLASPYEIHCRYETLHPFTDGNGRSGRALWAWQMSRWGGGYPLGFLHHFYYQALQATRP